MATAFVVNEDSTAKYTATLKDEDDAPIPKAAVEALTLTLYVEAIGAGTGGIINGRNNQDVLDLNGVTLHETSGLLTWIMEPEDNPIVGNLNASHRYPDGTKERHIALFRWEYFGGDRKGNHEVVIDAVNRTKIP